MAPLLTHPNSKRALDFSMLLGQHVQVYVLSCRPAFLEDAWAFFGFLPEGQVTSGGSSAAVAGADT